MGAPAAPAESPAPAVFSTLPLPAFDDIPAPASPGVGTLASMLGILLRSTSVMSVQLAEATSRAREASARECLTERIGYLCAREPRGPHFSQVNGANARGAG